MTLAQHDQDALDTTSWRELASCRDQDERWFFPPEDLATDERVGLERRAVAVCAQCPVRPTCLAYSQVTGQQYGVWGGVPAAERLAA